MDWLESDPFNSVGPEDQVSQIAQMVSEITMARRFTFLYAIYSSPLQRDQLMKAVQERLPQRRIQWIAVPQETQNLLHLLREEAEKSALDVVFAYGLENWLSGSQAPQSIPLLRNLNAARDSFPAVVTGSLILWIPQFVLHAIADAAPDFFSVRSGVYLFPPAPDNSQQVHDISNLFEHTELFGLDQQAVEIRINEMSSLLATIRSLPISERDRLDEAFVLSQLATAYESERDYATALSLYQEALAIQREVLPAKHPDIAQTLNNLAGLYYSQNRLDEALKLLQEALEIRREVLPPKHPDIAQSLNNIGGLYKMQNRLEEALPLYQEALEIRREVLPPKHLDIAQSINNIAVLYRVQNRLNEALKLSQEALEIRREVLPPKHADIAQSLNNLAGVYQNQKRFEEALPLYLEALEIRREVLPPNHPDLANSLNNIATLYCSQNFLEKALPLFQEALTIYQIANHHDIQLVTENIQKILAEMQRRGITTTMDKKNSSARLPVLALPEVVKRRRSH